MSVVNLLNDLLGHSLSYLDVKSVFSFLSTSKSMRDKNKLIQTLDFSWVATVTFEKFQECLRRYPAIMSLSVKGCKHLSDVWLKAVADLCPNLRKLDATSPLFTDAGLKHLERCRNLSEITLGSNEQFSSSGMVELVSKLPNLTACTMVGCAQLDDTVLKAVTLFCPYLEEISLQGLKCAITDEGIGQLNGLKKISFSFLPDSITNAGIQRVLQNSPKLKKAHFFEMPCINEEALMTLAISCKRLIELRFKNCKRLTSKGITEVLKKNPHLSLLQFWGTTPATDEWLSELAPHCTSLRTLQTKYQGPHADKLSKRWPWVAIAFPSFTIKSKVLQEREKQLKAKEI